MTFQLTDYGVDRHMAVNHFGHVILTSHLLPLMKKTSKVHNTKVRIVNLGSNAHQATPSSCKFANLEELNQDLGPNGQYGRSKLATMLYSRWLGRKLRENGHEDVLVNATHPGFVDTKMSREDIHEPYPVVGYAMSVGMAPFKKDQWMGCVSTVFASTKTEKTGEVSFFIFIFILVRLGKCAYQNIVYLSTGYSREWECVSSRREIGRGIDDFDTTDC